MVDIYYNIRTVVMVTASGRLRNPVLEPLICCHRASEV